MLGSLSICFCGQVQRLFYSGIYGYVVQTWAITLEHGGQFISHCQFETVVLAITAACAM